MISSILYRPIKAICIIVILLCSFHLVEGQRRPKYEDALPKILASDEATAVALIKSYMDIDPTKNASQYLQLGLIYHKRFTESDPLRQYKRAISNIELSQEALNLAIQYVNEKEVSKNKESYFNFGYNDERGKLQIKYDSIINTINKSLQEQQNCLTHLPAIYEAFSKSYQHYSKANQIFSTIIGRYKSAKDLYLLYDEDLRNELNELKSNYDLSLTFFEEYQTKKAAFDIGYNQKLKIEKIGIYRLDGLNVEVNFLQDIIPIWNYGLWVNEIQTYHDKDIMDLRKQMAQNEKLINLKLSKTQADIESNQFEQLKVDKEFLFRLKKFDLASVIEPLFLYKEHKHALLHHDHVANSIETDALLTNMRKMSSYGKILVTIRQADTILMDIISKDVQGSYEKYNEFIDEYYQGIAGIKQYANAEMNTNQQKFGQYIDKIQSLAYAEFEPQVDNSDLIYGNIRIPAIQVKDESDESKPDQHFTTNIIKNIDASEYLTGAFYHQKEQKKAAFVCFKNDKGKIVWYKELLLQSDSTAFDSNTEIAVLHSDQTGCVVVLNGTNLQTGTKYNRLVSLDNNGKQVMAHNLAISDYPRSINYIQSANTYLVTFKGSEKLQEIEKEEELSVENIDVSGVTVWKTHIRLKGNVTGIVAVEDGYIINGNYKEIQLMDGTMSTSTQVATYLLKLNPKGKQVSQLLLPEGKSYYSNMFFKTGDHSIHVFGSTKEYVPFGLESDRGSLVHIIVTKDLDLVYDSMQKK